VYTICSGIRPNILPDPVAKVRFTEDQLNQRDMPRWDANFASKLLVPKLPLPKKRRLFLMKIRSSGPNSPVNKSNGLGLRLWNHFSKTYSHLASSNIHRVDTFDARDSVELANLLEHTDIWACDHTIAAGSAPWPPLYTGRSKSNQCMMVQTLSSFGISTSTS
jgi:hypothetical protein